MLSYICMTVLLTLVLGIGRYSNACVGIVAWRRMDICYMGSITWRRMDICYMGSITWHSKLYKKSYIEL